MVDVNVGRRVKRGMQDMRWAIKTIQEVVDAPFGLS